MMISDNCIFGGLSVHADKEKSDRIENHLQAIKAENLERLRDEFAMAALSSALKGAFNMHGECMADISAIPKSCYEIADQMLKAREQSK